MHPDCPEVMTGCSIPHERPWERHSAAASSTGGREQLCVLTAAPSDVMFLPQSDAVHENARLSGWTMIITSVNECVSEMLPYACASEMLPYACALNHAVHLQGCDSSFPSLRNLAQLTILNFFKGLYEFKIIICFMHFDSYHWNAQNNAGEKLEED